MMLSDEDGREVSALKSATSVVPCAAAARYDRKSRRIIVLFSNGLELSIPIKLAQGLASEKASDLRDIEVSPAGLVLYWPRVETELYLPALVRGLFGPSQTRWEAYWSGWQDKPRRSSRCESQSWTASRKLPTQTILKVEQ